MSIYIIYFRGRSTYERFTFHVYYKSYRNHKYLTWSSPEPSWSALYMNMEVLHPRIAASAMLSDWWLIWSRPPLWYQTPYGCCHQVPLTPICCYYQSVYEYPSPYDQIFLGWSSCLSGSSNGTARSHYRVCYTWCTCQLRGFLANWRNSYVSRI